MEKREKEELKICFITIESILILEFWKIWNKPFDGFHKKQKKILTAVCLRSYIQLSQYTYCLKIMVFKNNAT